MRALVLTLLTGAVLGTASCSGGAFWTRTDVEKALPYKASLKEQKDGSLQVAVKFGGPSLAPVRESVRYPVTRFCLENKGSADADWVIDPATGDWAAVSDGRGGLVFQARCRRG